VALHSTSRGVCLLFFGSSMVVVEEPVDMPPGHSSSLGWPLRSTSHTELPCWLRTAAMEPLEHFRVYPTTDRRARTAAIERRACGVVGWVNGLRANRTKVQA
jgi:hypothetical protein